MSSKLRGLYQNVRGLRGKINRELKNKFTLANLDFIALTETWLNDDFSSSQLFDDTYNVFRSDRSVINYNLLRPNESNRNHNEDIRGGGCILALKNQISAIRLNEWEKETLFDNIWIKVNTKGSSKIFINTVYIPPWATFDHVNDYYEHIVDTINTKEPYARFILLGDFNLPSIDWFPNGDHQIALRSEGRFATELINMLITCNITQKNSIKNERGRVLDLIISNVGISVKRRNMNKIIVNEDKDHPSLDLELDRSDIKLLTSIKTSKLNFFNANYDCINNELRSIDWHDTLQSNDINESVDIFYNTLYEIINNHTPIITPKSDDYPKWFSKKLIEMIKDKEFYRKKMKKPNGEIYSQLFYLKRKEIKNEKRICLRNYVANIEPLVQSNPKSFFAYTKAQKQSNRLPSAMFYKAKFAENMNETADLFADYFASVYVNHANSFEPNNANVDTSDFVINRESIRKVISEINIFKTNSPDGIPGIFYKNTSENIIEPLHILFTFAISSMTYPTKWKISFISPIFKSGNNTNVENYRPISILSAVSKIFDKIIYFHIREKTSNLLVHQQHGFCAGKSTLSNLMEFTEYITQNMMNGGQVDTIFMDLAKAFDKIDHSILLNKLQALHVNNCTLRLIQSYLENRSQTVCVYGAKSKPIIPKSSVPQGSILSPLLFALFINDLSQHIKSNILLFADDLKIFLKIRNHEDAKKLQNDINTIVNWCSTNKLAINIAKCNAMSFTRRTESTFQFFNYNINNSTLNRVQHIKDLGINFDTKLSFESHIKCITKKAYRMIGFISRSLNHFVQLNTYKLLYFTYVRSNLEYCSPVWNPHYRSSIDMVEKVQRRFTRIIFKRFHYPAEINYLMRNVRLELLSLEDRRSVTDELTLFKIHNGTIQTRLNEQLQFNARTRATRQVNTFYLPSVRTNVEFFSPMLRMQRQHDERFYANDLNEQSLNTFKRYTFHEVNANTLLFDYGFMN